jgi:SAM-dependent methyltransferase
VWNLQKFRPSHGQNRMGHEGDVEGAREYYLSGKNRNLKYLLKSRTDWMNNFLTSSMHGVELGAGIGASRDFIQARSLILTDFSNGDWLDEVGVDALNTPFKNSTFDFVIASNMIHHVSHPSKFMFECERILKPGGLLLIQEIHTSLMMRLILRIMRHEGFDETIDVFDENSPCNDPLDPWSANCSVPKLLFDNHEKFCLSFPNWSVAFDVNTEFLTFLNSGGVIAKTKYIPMNEFMLTALSRFDKFLVFLLPNFFALQRQVVLKKLA